MSKTSVKNRICSACGSEIRSGALFCYHCGSSVAPEVVVALKDKRAVSDAWVKDNGSVSAQKAQSVNAESADKPIPKPVLPEEPKLKSAAAMRRRPKNIQPKKVEIIWDEHENAPNGWFILAAILLALFAAGVFYLAMYLK